MKNSPVQSPDVSALGVEQAVGLAEAKPIVREAVQHAATL